MGHSAAGPPPVQARAPASPAPMAHRTSGSRVGLRGRGCFWESAEAGHSSFPSSLPASFLPPPTSSNPSPLLSSSPPHLLLRCFHCWMSACSQSSSAKSLLSAFAYQLWQAGLVPPAPTLNICFWLASRRYGNQDPPTLSPSSPGWRKGPHLAGVGEPG